MNRVRVWLYPMLGAEENRTNVNDGREIECKILYQQSGKCENPLLSITAGWEGFLEKAQHGTKA